MVFIIKAEDLEELAKKNMRIKDKLQIAKLRVENKLVDDLDYFTFPKKYLEKNLQDKTRQDLLIQRKKYSQAKETMIKQFLHYAKCVENGTADIPQCLTVLKLIHQDRALQKIDLDTLNRGNYLAQAAMINVRGLFETMKVNKQHTLFLSHYSRLVDLYDDYRFDIETPTTIRSEDHSDAPIRQL